MNYAEILSLMATRPWAIDASAGAALCVDLASRIMRGEMNAGADVNPAFACEPIFVDAAPEAAIPGQTAAAVARKEGRVAVLPIRGTILPRAGYYGAGLEQISKQVTDLRNDNSVKAIVGHFDTLGGSVEGLPEAAAVIREAREVKPFVSMVGHRAASAGYWLASQGSEVVVSPSGDVGSIGVLTLHADERGLYKWLGIEMSVLRSSGAPFKIEGNPFEELGDEARGAIQADLDHFEAMFHGDIAAGRGVKASVVKETFGQGRMVLAEEAVKRGMADRVATLEQTLNRFGASLYGASGRKVEAPAGTPRRDAARNFLRSEELRSL